MTCATCDWRLVNGRASTDPIHCRTCHATWTGNEAQHCTRCHHTFVGIGAAEAHRYRRLSDGRNEDRCIDPAVTDGWREKRPGVWTNSDRWVGLS